MSEFTIHDIESAPAKAGETLQQAREKYGFVPNLLGVMASAPEELKAYVGLNELFSQTSFSPTEQQVVLLTVSEYNRCEYCVSAHSAIAGMQNVPEDVVQAIREGKPIADDKLEALRRFTRAVVDKRGWVDNQDIKAFLDAGYSRENILEVILGVSMKTLSNYTNHVAETPLDEAFQPQAWKKAG